jgi:hypothetical protein
LGFAVCCVSFRHDTISNDEINISRGGKKGGAVLVSNDKEVEVSRRKKDFFLMKMKEFYKD